MKRKKETPKFPRLSQVEKHLKKPRPSTTFADSQSRKYRTDRRFRFSIPSLNFKSGTQFELSNDKHGNNWSVKFFFGNSKAIRMLELSESLYAEFKSFIPHSQLESVIDSVRSKIPPTDSQTLQANWTSEADQIKLFELIDEFGDLVQKIELPTLKQIGLVKLIDDLANNSEDKNMTGVGIRKLNCHIDAICTGICPWFSS